MNQRIRELAKQAGMYVDLDGKPYPKRMGAEACEVAYKKFAELIVQECADLLWDESERLYAYSSECNEVRDSDEAEVTAQKCLDNIKMLREHFRVES